ncbi:SdrD B-like domain-containing protein [Leucothrix mucor]|uniref:SdrD B-like domain-containing protein n=1 Tax=Leucothrix mucor TaxID=45248 RepID=UPI0003B53E66|nr:SdrD B-like domain-containing protein [Leucothrix mucor]
MHKRLTKLLVCIMLSGSASIGLAAEPEIVFGPLDGGVNDGTEPFGSSVYDALGDPLPCASASDTDLLGADCGETNRVVRTQDLVTHNWSVSVNGGDDSILAGDPVLTDVVIEQTIYPSAGPGPIAVVTFDTLPTACREDAGGGTNPPSSIVANADGSSTLTCNLGEFIEGQGRIFSVGVKASGLSENGSSYTTTQRVYSLDEDGDENAKVNTFVDDRPIMISAAPAYDLIHSVSSTQAMLNSSVGKRDLGTGNGPELGFYGYMQIRMAAGRRTGIEAIEQEIVFKDVFKATTGSSAGPDYDLEFYVTQCTSNPSGWGTETWGSMSIRTDRPDSEHVLDSGTCTYERDDADPTSKSFTVTIDDVDLSGTHYPSRTVGGTDLTAGPYYVMNHRVQIWIPFRSVDLTDGILGNNTGEVWLSSLLKDFDPTSPSGVENYGGLKEPGYNGNLIDGERSNNQLGPALFQLVPKGNFSKRNLKYTDQRVLSYAYSGTSNYHSGDGELESGQTYAGWILVYNQGTVPFYNPIACDIFDNTTQQLTERGDVAATRTSTPGSYAFMGTYAPGGHDYRDYTIEYANIDLSGDDPLNGDGVVGYDYDVATGRYNGTWAKQSAARCDDASPSDGQWYTDPTQVPGGIDGVNAARARMTDTTQAFEPSHQIRFITPLKARDRFNGGPHDGDIIPVGTVLANFGNFRSDEWSRNWLTRSYEPSPETGSVDGDRVTLTRLKMVLDSHSISPYAAPANTTSTLAGKQIIWQVDTAVQSTLAEPSIAENLKIIDVLPPSASYNHSCTVAYEGGTPAGQVQYNTDKDGNAAPGYTRLIWELGDLRANTVIPPRIICTDSDPLADHGTAVINYAEIRADNVLSSLAARSDTHTISLEQVGEIQVSKTVDVPLDDRNDEQVYTMSWSNFSAAIRINNPVAIDILPFNGDGILERSPPSSFNGVLELVQAPTTAWLDGSVPDTSVTGGEDPIGTWYYSIDDPTTIDVDPDSNTSNWCLESDFNTSDCPTEFADVTAVKFMSNYPLEKDGNPRQGMNTKLVLKAGDSVDPDSTGANKSGDVYTNRFSLDSSTLPAAQFFQSGNATVQIASYSLGDFVFADIDDDGKYDPEVDYTAPDGVVVNLRKADGTLVRSTTIGLEKTARYVFNVLDSGDYYVEIPATEFQDGALLEHWTTSQLLTAADDDNDEGVDQHAYSTGTPAVDGVRTGTVTLSATPPVPGGIPLGNEPLGDNVAFITDPTGDDFSNLTLDMGLVPDTYEVTGTVWNDANNNGLRERTEVGIPNVTVVLYGAPWGDKRCRSVDTDANGFYKFDKVMTGSYQIFESDQSDAPFGYATCPPTTGDPDTYTSTTSNTRNINVYETHVRRQDFGDYNGIIIRGTVFDDNGLSSGTSANEKQDGGEKGIGGVKVVASDGSGTVYDTTRTATDGSYVLYVPGTATNVEVREYDPNGYVTTGAEVGNTSGSYSSSNDAISFTATAATEFTGLDFGDVRKPVFEPDHTGEILPGNVVFYAHQFKTQAAGTVSFDRTSDINKSVGWASLLYRDSNCDGVLNGAEGQMALSTTGIDVDAGDSVCIIDKVYAPSNVAAGDRYRVTTTATYQFGGSALGSIALTVTDVTTAAQSVAPALPATPAVDAAPAQPVTPAVDATPTTPATPAIDATPAQPAVAATPVTPAVGPSRLELRKSVQNKSKGTAETETVNQADPGDVLIYRIYYSNTGTGPLTELQVNDRTPAYTSLEANSAKCVTPIPSGMNCVPVESFDAVRWEFTGPLLGGHSGSVRYEVRIDN